VKVERVDSFADLYRNLTQLQDQNIDQVVIWSHSNRVTDDSGPYAISLAPFLRPDVRDYFDAKRLAELLRLLKKSRLRRVTIGGCRAGDIDRLKKKSLIHQLAEEIPWVDFQSSSSANSSITSNPWNRPGEADISIPNIKSVMIVPISY